MKKQKKIPSPVMRWIYLVGSIFGLLFAGVTFIILPKSNAMPVWFGLVLFAIVWMYVTEWRNRDLLEEWGISGKKSKKGEIKP